MATKTKTRKREKAQAAPEVLNVAFVWDMSGSMAQIRDATIEGTSKYISDLQKEEAKLVAEHGEGVYTRFSLTAFDTVFEKWIVNEPIASIDVPSMISRYQPRGWTALYDAIANTITDVSAIRGEAKNLLIVMTDGQENSSVEYGGEGGRQRLFDLVKAYEAKGNWTFVYLGANVDAYAEARSIGIPTGNAAFYSASGQSVATASASLTGTTSGLRTNKAHATTDFFVGENDFRDEDDSS